jgi:hypothetical protein
MSALKKNWAHIVLSQIKDVFYVFAISFDGIVVFFCP